MRILSGTLDLRAQALVKLVIAKTKIYNAKVGVMEHRRRSSERRGEL